MTATSWYEARRFVFERWRRDRTGLRFCGIFGGRFFQSLNGLNMSSDVVVGFDDRRLMFSTPVDPSNFAITLPLVLVSRFEFVDEISFPSELRQHANVQRARLRAACIMTVSSQNGFDIAQFALCEFSPFLVPSPGAHRRVRGEHK
jgi:hypothetical protein